jgi:hypothetical protein
MVFVGPESGQNDSAVKQAQQPLEIRVTEPIRWENGCLRVHIDRINRSAELLFLPVNGLFIESSVLELTDDIPKGQKEAWRTAYGASDIISYDLIRLSSGEFKRDDYCVGPRIPLLSRERESRREVPMRGKLQVYAVYYPAQHGWLTSKAQGEADRQRATSTTLELSIPCPEAGCAAECTRPPVILEDEKIWVPDVTRWDKAYITRGRALNEELARKFQQCPN